MTPHDAARIVVRELAHPGVYRATKFLSEHLTVKATRIGKGSLRSRAVNARITMGRPNFSERAFIKRCRAAGEPFPVRKVQLKWFRRDHLRRQHGRI